MTFQECLDYLYNQLPMFHRVGSSAYKKSLDNIILLCEAIGNPQHQFKSVHIAGTNGKGSSSNMVAAILQTAGYKTGLYTSPHLKSFTERIKINGQDIPEDYIIQFVQNFKFLFEKIEPSFFEMTVALAFKYFAEQKIDIAVIEVGLGGRLDSTNIITPIVSLITNISYDHQNILGNTLAEIATEKSGIIKPGISAVISKTQLEIKQIFEETAALNKAPLFFADEEIEIIPIKQDLDYQEFNVKHSGNVLFDNLKVSLLGEYQRYNLSGVLKLIELLKAQGWNISDENIRDGLSNINNLTGFKGRWHILNKQPLTICDTGHNPDGISHILRQLQKLKKDNNIHFIFGLVKDKDVSKIISLLPPDYIYYFCQANIPRALPAPELQNIAADYKLPGNIYLNVGEALAAAQKSATLSDIIFIGGSTFIVAEIPDL